MTINTSSFQAQVLDAPLPVLVDFWAEWCGPCRTIAPVLESLASEWQGRILVAKVNVDHCPDLASRYGVSGIPTLILFEGGEPLERLQGAMPKETIRAKLEQALP